MIPTYTNPSGLFKFCLFASGVTLALSAVFKLISASGTAGILTQADPIFGMANRWVFVSAGVVEFFVVCTLALSSVLSFKLRLIAVLSTDFLIYRVGILWLDVRQPCPCLGNAAAWLHVQPDVIDAVAKMALGLLLFCSYVPLLLLWWQKRVANVDDTV